MAHALEGRSCVLRSTGEQYRITEVDDYAGVTVIELVAYTGSRTWAGEKLNAIGADFAELFEVIELEL